MKRILFIRHGESREQAGESKDGVNSVLSRRGKRQAATLGARLADVRFQFIYVSPLARAAQTFARAGLNCEKAVYDSRIIEIEWRPGWYRNLPEASLPPGPQPDRQNAWLDPTYQRLAAFLAEIERSEERLGALVGHQGSFRCLVELFLQLPHDGEPIRLRSDNCSISELGIEEDGTKFIRYWNDYHHILPILNDRP